MFPDDYADQKKDGQLKKVLVSTELSPPASSNSFTPSGSCY